LLAWNAEVNAVDINGITPLHLAIKSSEELKSSRSVRHLLIKGAERGIKDK
jgi:ankyrin repeat protein